MGNLVANFVLNHQQYFVGVACGVAIAHVPQLTAACFHALMKVGIFRRAVLNDPAKSKALLEQITKELEKDIDEEAANTKNA